MPLELIARLARRLTRPQSEHGAPSSPSADDEPVSEAAAIHLTADRGLIRLCDGHLLIDSGEEQHRLRLDDIASLSIHGEAGITSPALRSLAHRRIPLVFRTRSGHYAGQVVDLSTAATAVRRAQYAAAADPRRRLEIARTIVRCKLVQVEAVMLRRHGPKASRATVRRMLADLEVAESVDALRGLEGAAASLYFAALPDWLSSEARPHFPFEGRRRRPPTDALNALLSYLYAVLTGECASAALAAGLDPMAGFLHAERPGRPALALDLVEPLRSALADALALELVNRRRIAPADFVHGDDGVRLNDGGRRLVLAALERRLQGPWQASSQAAPSSVRGAVATHAATLAAALRRGEAWRSPFAKA